jgi:hypothetical protein
MAESQRSPNLSRRGVLATTAGIGVGAGVAAIAGGGSAVAAPNAAGDPQGVVPFSVGVNFNQWGSIYLAPGQVQDWWFTWIFDANHWSRMSALPVATSPAGSSVQIVTEWATPGTLNVRFQNNGGVGVIFQPTVIVAP